MATFTIVVSSRIMKNPVVRTTSTSHGLVRACAMSSPQQFMSRTHSCNPLQLDCGDLALEAANPIALRFEHGDLVLQLDQRQPRHAAVQELGHDPGQLLCERIE